MTGKYDAKNIAIIVFLSYAVVTILNVLIHKAFPSVPVIQTGFALILLLASIVLILLFTVASDGKFDKEDITGILVVVAIMVALVWIIKIYVPELFSVLPSGLRETFSFIP